MYGVFYFITQANIKTRKYTQPNIESRFCQKLTLLEKEIRNRLNLSDFYIYNGMTATCVTLGANNDRRVTISFYPDGQSNTQFKDFLKNVRTFNTKKGFIAIDARHLAQVTVQSPEYLVEFFKIKWPQNVYI